MLGHLFQERILRMVEQRLMRLDCRQRIATSQTMELSQVEVAGEAMVVLEPRHQLLAGVVEEVVVDKVLRIRPRLRVVQPVETPRTCLEALVLLGRIPLQEPEVPADTEVATITEVMEVP